MAYPRSKIRTNRSVQDNRKRPKIRPDTAPKGKRQPSPMVRPKKSPGPSPMVQPQGPLDDPAASLSEFRDRLRRGIARDVGTADRGDVWKLSDGTTLPLADAPLPTTGPPPPPSPWHERVMRAPPEAPPTPMTDYLLNTDLEDRVPTRPGWNPLYGQGWRERAAGEGTSPGRDLFPGAVKADVRAQRAALADQLQANMAERGLPAVQSNAPLTTQTARIGSTVNAMPRPVGDVERELQGTPNFDRAAGPRNEQWQAALESREAVRDERMENVRANARQEAQARRERIREREAAPRPRTNMMGALWNVDPALAANVGMRMRGQNLSEANARRQAALEQQQFGNRSRLTDAQIDQMEAETGLTRQAGEEAQQLKSQINTLEGQIAGTDKPRQERRLRNRLRDAEDRLDRLISGEGGQRRSSDSTRPQTQPLEEQSDTRMTTEEETEVSYMSQTPYGQRLGLDADEPQRGIELGKLMIQDVQGDEFTEPQAADIETIIPALRHGLKDSLQANDPRRPAALVQQSRALALGAQRLPGDPEDPDDARAAAAERVRAAMEYFRDAEEGEHPDGEPPVVGGYQLTPVESERQTSGGFGAGGFAHRPRTVSEPYTTYEWKAVQ